MKKILSIIVLLLFLAPAQSLAIDCANGKIIDYMVVEGRYRRDNFSDKVSDLIKAGWQPFGNVIFISYIGFFQAMVKYEE